MHHHIYVPQIGDQYEDGEPVSMCLIDGCYAVEERTQSFVRDDSARFDALGRPRG